MPGSTSTPSCEQPLVTRVLGAPGRHPAAAAWLACLAAAAPFAVLAWDAAAGLLGPNPPERALRELGRWALILLLVVLAATPLRHALTWAARKAAVRYGRRPGDWNWMLRLRRHVGLASVAYAVAHLFVYLSADAGFDWREIATDLRSKPFVAAGIGALALLLPLAATSTDGWMRRLKRGWKRLHMLVYPAAALAVLHFFWLSKPGWHDADAYVLVLAVLLGYRAVKRWLPARELANPAADPVVAEVLDERPQAPAQERRAAVP
jgi:methionine sulfoxide reductase heme-binding subunit